ncbi:hypothetical protein [Halotalea alkalilenta]|uniref:TonB C-terminal domain-containing protein n=1 Tax=Halotalea alkalilenta TaxID=376489 RepID=A0A172YIC7_9GAMM|nr:hypothetical protein [Halotalea alkalilenta]ANF58974.1 hypothetical protein A5892_17140 [Halotalea alkalilenta]
MSGKANQRALCCAALVLLAGCASPNAVTWQQDEACRHYEPQAGATFDVLTCPLPEYPYAEVVQVSPRDGGMLFYPDLAVVLILELQADGSVEVLGTSASEHVSHEFLTRVTNDVKRWRTNHRSEPQRVEQAIVFTARQRP